jgi:hypothetical protein
MSQNDFLVRGGEVYEKAASPSTTYPGYQVDGSGSYTGQSTSVNSEVLVPKLADEVIPYIRQQSYMRQFFRTIDMPTLTFNVPKINVGADVFFIDEAKPAPFTAINTETVTLQAKKLMTALTLSSELTEDNIVPILPHIKRDIAKAFALAEEEVFLYGNTAPATNAYSDSIHWSNTIRGGAARAVTRNYSENATESNWFKHDKRLAFNGLSLLAEPSFNGSLVGSPGDPATKINAGNKPLSIDDVNNAIESLDVFGRDKSQLLLIVSLREEKALRADPTILTTLEKFGPSAVFLTGEIGKVYGISTVATNLISTYMGSTYTADGINANYQGEHKDSLTTNNTVRKSEAFVVNRNALLIGDRRLFTLKASDIPFMLADQLLLVATERIAMAAQFRKAVCKIENIGE